MLDTCMIRVWFRAACSATNADSLAGAVIRTEGLGLRSDLSAVMIRSEHVLNHWIPCIFWYSSLSLLLFHDTCSFCSMGSSSYASPPSDSFPSGNKCGLLPKSCLRRAGEPHPPQMRHTHNFEEFKSEKLPPPCG